MKLVVPSSGSMIQVYSDSRRRAPDSSARMRVVRVGFAQRLDDRLLGRAVDLGDEVVLALGGDGEPVEVERGAVDDRAGARAPP